MKIFAMESSLMLTTARIWSRLGVEMAGFSQEVSVH